MNSSKALRIGILILAILAFTFSLYGQTQQPVTPNEGETLHVLVGKSVVINVQAPITRALSSNPAAVETLAISPTQLVIEGKSAGSSSLILWDSAEHSQVLDVVVDLDIGALRSAVQRSYPASQIEVQADAGRLILTGSVSDPKIVDDLGKMATAYSPQVVNSVTVETFHEPQVLLEVKFAEIDRTKLQQFGINIFSTGAANTPGSVTTQQFGPPAITGDVKGTIGAGNLGATSSFHFNDLLNIFVFRPDLNLGATIKDLEQKTVLQILAEPNMIAMNGQKASFLAGGEFPFPVVQGGANVGAVTVQFRPFGVRLDFTGYAGRDGIIRLHVAPEVSTLDFANALVISGFTVPALSTRRAETEIELKDGQSFGIAGLLDHRATVQLSKVPGIADIPVLGQLFRSRSVTRTNTELVVIVTPHVIDPVRAVAVVPPLPKPVTPYLDMPKFDKDLPGNKEAGPPPPGPSSK
jgi:pilus assembly protein CpaC